jgi:hypothetical protein
MQKLPTPSPRGVSVFNSDRQATIFVVEPILEPTEAIAENAQEDEEEQTPVLEHDIECPRCHDSMMLCSDFDSLYYVCEECDFCLYTIKKN